MSRLSCATMGLSPGPGGENISHNVRASGNSTPKSFLSLFLAASRFVFDRVSVSGIREEGKQSSPLNQGLPGIS